MINKLPAARLRKDNTPFWINRLITKTVSVKERNFSACLAAGYILKQGIESIQTVLRKHDENFVRQKCIPPVK